MTDNVIKAESVSTNLESGKVELIGVDLKEIVKKLVQEASIEEILDAIM